MTARYRLEEPNRRRLDRPRRNPRGNARQSFSLRDRIYVKRSKRREKHIAGKHAENLSDGAANETAIARQNSRPKGGGYIVQRARGKKRRVTSDVGFNLKNTAKAFLGARARA